MRIERYRILQQCINIHHSREDRHALNEHLATHPARAEWGGSVPYSTYVSCQFLIPRPRLWFSSLTDGKAAAVLDHTSIRYVWMNPSKPGTKWLQYILGSHNEHDQAILSIMRRSQIRLREGDILVWKGSTAFYCLEEKGGARFMLIRFSPRPWFRHGGCVCTSTILNQLRQRSWRPRLRLNFIEERRRI